MWGVCVWWRHTISSTLTEAWLLRVWWRPGGVGCVCMVEAHYQQYIDRGLATQGVVETRGCGVCVYVWWRLKTTK